MVSIEVSLAEYLLRIILHQRQIMLFEQVMNRSRFVDALRCDVQIPIVRVGEVYIQSV